MKLVYLAVFYPFDEGIGYTVEFPDLPGCITEGSTLEEALDMASEAASGWILGEIEDGFDIPVPSRNIDLSEYDGAEFTNYISIDMEEYAKQYGQTAVKKTLTIPRWLNTLSEKKGINFSQVLQNALKSELDLNIENVQKQEENDSLSLFVNEIIGKIEDIHDFVEIETDKQTASKRIILDQYRIAPHTNSIEM